MINLQGLQLALQQKDSANSKGFTEVVKQLAVSQLWSPKFGIPSGLDHPKGQLKWFFFSIKTAQLWCPTEARTGSGKTLAYLYPAAWRFFWRDPGKRWHWGVEMDGNGMVIFCWKGWSRSFTFFIIIISHFVWFLGVHKSTETAEYTYLPSLPCHFQ